MWISKGPQGLTLGLTTSIRKKIYIHYNSLPVFYGFSFDIDNDVKYRIVGNL